MHAIEGCTNGQAPYLQVDDLGDKHWNELVHENTFPLRAELIFLEEKCAGNDSKCLGAFLIQFILSGEKRISKSFIFVAKYVGNIDNLTDLKILVARCYNFLLFFGLKWLRMAESARMIFFFSGSIFQFCTLYSISSWVQFQLWPSFLKVLFGQDI